MTKNLKRIPNLDCSIFIFVMTDSLNPALVSLAMCDSTFINGIVLF